MKVDTSVKRFFILLIILMMAASAWTQSAGGGNAARAFAPGSTVYVSAKTVNVKVSANFFARAGGILSKGDAVTVQQNSGKWILVRSATGVQGWVPLDAFSSRRILDAGSGFSTSEYALAGKGFNSDLEKILFSSGELDFSLVDAMEKNTVESDVLRAFLNEGRLASGD